MSWFAIQTMPQSEQRAKTSIERMGFNVQLPVLVERRQRYRGGKLIKSVTETPMFQGYVFLEAAYVPEWMNKECWVLRPLPNWNEPRAIPERLVQAAISRSGEITVDQWRTIKRFAAGDEIKRKGDNSGLTGTVLSVEDEHLVVLFVMLGKEHLLVLGADQVEAA